jgi:hypothetical protein
MSTVNEEKEVASKDAAIHKQEPSSNTFEGKVVSITGGKLVMTNKAGKEYPHTLATDAKLTCDGTVCKAEDLKAGSKIRVTTKPDDQNVATCIESLDKNAAFAQCCSCVRQSSSNNIADAPGAGVRPGPGCLRPKRLRNDDTRRIRFCRHVTSVLPRELVVRLINGLPTLRQTLA